MSVYLARAGASKGLAGGAHPLTAPLVGGGGSPATTIPSSTSSPDERLGGSRHPLPLDRVIGGERIDRAVEPVAPSERLEQPAAGVVEVVVAARVEVDDDRLLVDGLEHHGGAVDSVMSAGHRRNPTRPGFVPVRLGSLPMSAISGQLKRRGRRLATLAARPTYGSSLSFVMGRGELPRVLNSLGLLGVGAEVGVRLGEFSEEILAAWRGRRLISIDSWAVQPGDDPADPLLGSDAQERCLAETRARLARFGDRSEIRRRDSLAAAAEMPPASLDFVYIDAAHEYEPVRADIEAWHSRVRPGGLLCGHDYYDGFRSGAMYGVARAVDEFCDREGLRVTTTVREHPERSWFVRIPEAGA